MNRQALTGLVFALCMAAAALSTLAGKHERNASDRAESELSRASAQVRRSLAKTPRHPAAERLLKVCPRGAEGLANTARRSIRRKLLTEEGSVDPVALAEMSNIAIASARYLEGANAAPALPQRLGRQRVTTADGDSWEPLAYPSVGCAMVPRNRRP